MLVLGVISYAKHWPLDTGPKDGFDRLAVTNNVPVAAWLGSGLGSVLISMYPVLSPLPESISAISLASKELRVYVLIDIDKIILQSYHFYKAG